MTVLDKVVAPVTPPGSDEQSTLTARSQEGFGRYMGAVGSMRARARG